MIELKKIHEKGQTKVLWVSRHPPIPAQIRELDRVFNGTTIYQLTGRIPNAEYIDEVAKTLNIKYIVAVLPLSMIARLTEIAEKRWYRVLWAEMEEIKQIDREPVPGKDYDPDREVWIRGYEGTFKIMRFKKFHRIKRIVMEMEEVK